MTSPVIQTSENALPTILHFVVRLTVHHISKFNYLLTLVFPYHAPVTVRLTDNVGTWLIFSSSGHLLSFLGQHGLHSLEVRHD